MKIKERTKKFVKDHKGEIIAGTIGAGAALMGYAGFVLGRKFTYGEFEHYTGIDFTRDFAYNVKDCLLNDVFKEDNLTEDLIKSGFDAVDNQAKLALFVQKK